jgi:hypothetical protein
MVQGTRWRAGGHRWGSGRRSCPPESVSVVSDLSSNLDRIHSIWGHRRLTTYRAILLLTWENLTETAMASRAGSA